MEDSGTAREGQGQRGHTQGLPCTKPLHRFVQNDPKSLGVAILIFACAEMIMGIVLARDPVKMSFYFYIPFWQGALFLVCGVLSIYTGIHPSKKMVTACLAMYVVSVLGVLVSICSRSVMMSLVNEMGYLTGNSSPGDRRSLLVAIEAMLVVCSFCVLVLLIFMCCISRLALKSTHTQLVLHIASPVTETPTE